MKVSGTRRARNASAKGRNLFQVRNIRWSYRIRGSVARIQINTIDRNNALNARNRLKNGDVNDEEKNTAVNILMARILVYSAIKIKANRPLLYSTLNPETSSDSPSAKSNGVRFVSARQEINHINAIGGIKNIIHEY